MQKLSDAEEQIMSIIWFYDGGISVAKAVAADTKHPDLYYVTEQCKMRYGKDWKLQTVATFLTRLHQKGYIDIYRVGRYSHYKPIITLEEYRKVKLNEVSELLFRDNMNQLISFAAKID